MEIIGIPVFLRLMRKMKTTIAAELGDNIKPKDIDAVLRVRTSSKAETRLIIVRFTPRRLRERLFANSTKSRINDKDFHDKPDYVN